MVYPLISEDECPLWGQVLYVNAGAVDAPIAVVRSNYSEYQYANSQWNLRTFPTYTLYPHWTSRGEPDLATTNLGNVLPCTTGASAPPCAQNIGWPAGMTPYMQQQYTRLAWLGSLVENKHDSGLNGGLTYRRNRYLDGKTGRFSQLDPIGLAGGLNSYGYANGDPVSFADPFGLCPWCVGAGVGALLGGGGTMLYNYLHDQPLSANLLRNSVLGAAAGATLGVGLPALLARTGSGAIATTVAGAGGGLTARIGEALTKSGPDMSSRVEAVLAQVPPSLTTLLKTAQDGVVTIQGGAGSNLRQIILNPDGPSVIKAFDSAKNAWTVVREITH